MAHSATIGRGRLSSFLNLLAAPFVGIGRFLILLAEANPKMRELERLGKMSDKDLATKGKTREGEIRRILGVSVYL